MEIKDQEVFNSVAVLGAAGKMGSGISLLLLQQMACQITRKSTENQSLGNKLILIDSNEEGFIPLKHYLRVQLKKFAERNINDLRNWYVSRKDLIDNKQMIEAFIETAMDCVRCGCIIEECRGATMVFEAIVEDVEVKADVFSKLNNILGSETFYFTNTSSIPIEVLQEKSYLQRRLIGFHFYNPPAVQRLVEIIVPKNIDPQLKTSALNIAKFLKKIVVFSNDVAGFIGNGHFIREIHFACQKVREFTQHMPLSEAIFMVNRVTQEFLLRPMGLFQLVDYVGIDVGQRIAKIMKTYLPGNAFEDGLIGDMVKDGRWGGQYGDGSQKDGFFHYENGMPLAVYDLKRKIYIPFSESKISNGCEKFLGVLPEGHFSWKFLSKDSEREEKISEYFRNLWDDKTSGAELAKEFLRESQKIAHSLVSDGVANSIEDVDTVLKNGFFHLYGVDFPFAEQAKYKVWVRKF